MAKVQKQPEPAPIPGDEAQEPPKSYRGQIALGLAALILFQMIVLWSVLPPRTVVQDRGGLHLPAGEETFGGVRPLPPEIQGPTDLMVERQIGEGPIRVRAQQNDANVTFALVMHVQIRQREERAFDREYERRMNAVMTAVTTVLQGSTSDEREEIGYTAIREKSKRAINQVLGTPWVQTVFVRDVVHETN